MPKFEIVSSQEDSPHIFDQPDGAHLVDITHTQKELDIIGLSNRRQLVDEKKLQLTDTIVEESLRVCRVVGVDENNTIVFERIVDERFHRTTPAHLEFLRFHFQIEDSDPSNLGFMFKYDTHLGELMAMHICDGPLTYHRLFAEFVAEWPDGEIPATPPAVDSNDLEGEGFVSTLRLSKELAKAIEDHCVDRYGVKVSRNLFIIWAVQYTIERSDQMKGEFANTDLSEFGEGNQSIPIRWPRALQTHLERVRKQWNPHASFNKVISFAITQYLKRRT